MSVRRGRRLLITRDWHYTKVLLLYTSSLFMCIVFDQIAIEEVCLSLIVIVNFFEQMIMLLFLGQLRVDTNVSM